jgi:hypothetical protein
MRYPRYSFKYQGFRSNYRFFPHSYQYGGANNEYNEFFMNSNNDESSTTAENEISLIEEPIIDNQSDFFIQSSSNQQKKMSSKVIDLLDIDWSILNNRYFNNLNKTNSRYETVYNPSFILSTIGTVNDCLDEKMKEKIKDFIGKDKISKEINNEDDGTYISGLNLIKNKIKSKTLHNNSFKLNSGICMRNDIERRKSLFFHQMNKHIENSNCSSSDSTATTSFISTENFLSTNDILNDHFSFYQQTLDLLKDEDF